MLDAIVPSWIGSGIDSMDYTLRLASDGYEIILTGPSTTLAVSR